MRRQPGDGAGEAVGSLAAQEGAVERAVEVAADEVVGAGVAQVDVDAGDVGQRHEVRVAGDVFATDHLAASGAPSCATAEAARKLTIVRAACDSGAAVGVSR